MLLLLLLLPVMRRRDDENGGGKCTSIRKMPWPSVAWTKAWSCGRWTKVIWPKTSSRTKTWDLDDDGKASFCEAVARLKLPAAAAQETGTGNTAAGMQDHAGGVEGAWAALQLLIAGGTEDADGGVSAGGASERERKLEAENAELRAKLLVLVAGQGPPAEGVPA